MTRFDDTVNQGELGQIRNDLSSEIPSSWVLTTLGDAFKWGSGGTPKSGNEEFYGGSIPWLVIGDLNDGIVNESATKITDLGLKNSSAKLVEAGAILLAMYGSIGKLGIAGKPLATNQAIAFTNPSEVNRLYLFYFLRYARNSLSSLGKGATQLNISQTVIKSFPFVLAPKSEQQRIVTKIEELFSELDKGIESLQTAQTQLKVYRQALLRHAFDGKLAYSGSKVPWDKKELGDLLDFLTSGSRGWAQYYATTGDLFIRAQNIKHDRLELSDIAFVALPERTEGLRTRVRKGDLLITITGANVTKSALVEHDLDTSYVSQHVALCRPTNAILPRFLYWYIIAEAAGRKQLNKMAYGAGKPGLNLENIRSVQVSLPPLPEQKKIVEIIEGKLSDVEHLDKSISTALQQAESLRQSILKKAFSGKLVPLNSDDEPASILLARIKAGLPAQPQGKRTPK